MSAPIVIEPPPKKTTALDIWNAKLHPDLFQAPFSVLIVGSRNTGKSVLARALLSKTEGMYGAVYPRDNKIFFSPTLNRDTTFDDVEFGEKFNPSSVGIGALCADMVEQQKENLNLGIALRALLVFDDITQVASAWETLLYLGYVGRHSALDTIAIAHKLSSIPRGVRTQSQQWIFFKPKERSEWDWILELFAQKKSKIIWERALTRAWDIPYNFVTINFEKREPQDVYRSGLRDPLFTDEEWQSIITNGDPPHYDNRGSTLLDKSPATKDAALLTQTIQAVETKPLKSLPKTSTRKPNVELETKPKVPKPRANKKK
jgi:hypothetical protein